MQSSLSVSLDKNKNTSKFRHIKEYYSVVYFMFFEDEIIYIGKSLNGRLNSRMRSHQTHSEFFKTCARIEVIVFDNASECSLYEIYYIEKFKPKFNSDMSKDFFTDRTY